MHSINYHPVPFIVGIQGQPYRIYHPVHRDALLQTEMSGTNNPWWAYVWSSGIVLANHILSTYTTPLNILEVGCGLGLTSIASSLMGHKVSVTDVMPEVKEYLRLNSSVHGAPHPRWIDDMTATDEVFDIVMASDTLYNIPQIPIMLSRMYDRVKDGGVLILVEPTRRSIVTQLDLQLQSMNMVHTYELVPIQARGDCPTSEETDMVRIYTISK